MEWLHISGVFGFFVIFSGAQNIPSPSHSPSYLISGPKVLRPGIPTTLSVTILTESPVLVISEIINDNISVARTQNTIQGGSTKLQVLPSIPDNDRSYWSPYELVINGYIGSIVVFTNSTPLMFSPKSSSTFIQTDKPNYRPGQVVKIRAVSIHPADGRPYESQIDILIKDPKGNMIRQWLSLDSVLGVASEEFQLSENPPLGMWTIVTTVNEVMKEKQFNVDNYVLPKFEVHIEVPTTLYYEDDLRGTVTAQYLYGKPVSGHMNITYVHIFHGLEELYGEDKIIDGSVGFTFALRNYDNYKEQYKRSMPDYMDLNYDEYKNDEYVDIIVHVTEFLTGVTHHSSMKVTLAKCKYNLAFRGYPSIIKPSLNFSAELKVSTYNKRPLTAEAQQQTVSLSVTQHRRSPFTWIYDVSPRVPNSSLPSEDYPVPYDEIPVQEMVLPVPADGVIPIQIQLSDQVSTLSIEADFEDAHKRLELYSSYSSPSQSYIQLLRGSTPQVGVPLQLTVQSSFPLSEFHYLVMSRGQVLTAGRESSPSFTLTPDEAWAPLACVLVFFIRPDGEIINDVLHVPFTQVLRNSMVFRLDAPPPQRSCFWCWCQVTGHPFILGGDGNGYTDYTHRISEVSLNWSQNTAQPADGVELSVSVSESGSLVGILVVDKGTKWSKLDNDITEKMVMEELAEYSMDMSQLSPDGMKMGDPYSIFMACNLMVLTDANLNEEGDQLTPEFPGEGIHILYTDDSMDYDMDHELRVRRNFPETWLWLDANMGDSTRASFPLTVPDSITSWVATAFVMSENLGLGIVSAPVELIVFQDFFLSLNLPAFIIRGELLLLEVILFNYMDEDLEVMVIVAASDTFEFVSQDNEGISMASVRRVLVWSQNGTSVLFPIRPTVLGEIPISVRAVSSVASDTVFRTVLVKPEGIEQSFTKTLFLEFALTQDSLSREILFTFPTGVVQGSERATVTAIGDILGPSITGLESLIQMPYGCGEQNMIHFAPNIYVLQYLTSTGQAQEETRSKAISYMMEGYQRELSYQRDDSSFSAFGDSDYSGSTWLSAFVLRCFLQARPFITIDQAVLSRTAAWLVAQQMPDGSFNEPGRVIHTELQGGLDGPVSLTAYVLMALLEDDGYRTMYAGQVSGALSYLHARLDQGISSNYSLSLVTYALSLTNNSIAGTALTELMSRADQQDGVPVWSFSDAGLSDSWQPRSADIEMAAYVLLSLHRQARVEEGFSLMKWLSQQRNHLGGYGSTQDTVIALQALSGYATLSGSDRINLNILVETSSGMTVRFTIDGTNYLLYQRQEIEVEEELHIVVSAEGRGFALFQLTTFYNVESSGLSRKGRDADHHEAFDLHIDVMDTDMYNVHLYICTRLRENPVLNQTGMAILEVGLLSGFSLAQYGILTDDLVRRVETPPGKVIIYLDSVTTTEECVEIPTVVEFKVTKVQDATVVIYDYYEPRRRTVRTYMSEERRDMSPCSFCGDDDNCVCVGEDGFVFGTASLTHQRHAVASSLVWALLILGFCF